MIDWHIILTWIFVMATNAKDALGFGKQILDTTKTGLEILEAGKKLLEQDTDDESDDAIERAQAIAEIAKGLVPLTFAEVIFYAIRTAAVLLLVRWLLDALAGHRKR